MKGIYSNFNNHTMNNIVSARTLEDVIKKIGADEWNAGRDGYNLYRNGCFFGVLKIIH